MSGLLLLKLTIAIIFRALRAARAGDILVVVQGPRLVACEKERNIAENMEKWTDDALDAIGLTTDKLLALLPGA